MSEQPSVYNSNEYHQARRDGAVEMDQQTDVWLKASELPLRTPSAETAPVRELTELEKQAVEIRIVAEKLRILNEIRLMEQAA